MKWIKYSRYTGEDLGIERRRPAPGALRFLARKRLQHPVHAVQRVEPAHARGSEERHPAGARAGQDVRPTSACRADDGRSCKSSPKNRSISCSTVWSRSWWTKATSPSTSRIPSKPPRGGAGNGPTPRSNSRSPTNRSTSWASRRSRICWGRSANQVSGAHDTRDLATGVEASGRVEALRIRRHAEPGRQRDAVLRHPARGRQGAARSGVLRPARAPVRVSELLRHGADARLQPQHDSVRRGPLHAGQEGGAGAGAPDPHAISRRQPALRAVPRLGRGAAPSASWRACRWVRTTPTRATA